MSLKQHEKDLGISRESMAKDLREHENRRKYEDENPGLMDRLMLKIDRMVEGIEKDIFGH